MAPSSDTQWEAYGKHDPYFGVMCSDRFRRNRLDAQSLEEFFASGERHVDYVLRTIRSALEQTFEPRRVLDFGCGAARCTIPLARASSEVQALDVSDSMLREAEKNCRERSIDNVRFLKADDQLANAAGPFDLIHSSGVFIHIRPARGYVIFSRMLERLAEGGVLAIDFLCSRSEPVWARALGRLRATITPLHYLANVLQSQPWRQPLMEKNVYSLNELAFALHSHGRYKINIVTFETPPQYFALLFAQKRRANEAHDDRDWY
jgi:SAM-dependent methyltransferase